MKEGRTAVVVVDGHRTPWDVATSLARHSSVTVARHILFSHALDGPRRTGSLRLSVRRRRAAVATQRARDQPRRSSPVASVDTVCSETR